MSVKAVLAIVLAVLAVMHPHAAAVVAVTVVAGPVVVLGCLIFSVIYRTGWGVVPVRRSLA